MSRAWMPLYVGDFTADTMHLGATETGIYIRLIMHCWQHGTIPRDDRRLAIISHCDTRLWHLYRETVLQFFDVVDASTMHHKRVSTELQRYEELSNKRKGAALQKHKKKDAIAVQLHTQSQSPSPIKKDAAFPVANATGAIVELFPAEIIEPQNLEKELYQRGRAVLGKNAGGIIKKLLKAKDGKVTLARAAIETAAEKHDPREYIGGIIRNKEIPDSADRRVDPRL